MTLRLYASYGDYQQITDDLATPEARVTRLLRDASRDVDRAVVGAIYTTDPQGYPVDANLIDVFKTATAFQAEFLRDLDDDSGAKGRMDSITVGSLRFQRTKGTGGLTLRPIGPRALTELRLAGVLQVAPMVNW